MRCEPSIGLGFSCSLPVHLRGAGRGQFAERNVTEGEGQPLAPNPLLPLTLDQFGFRQTNLCPLPMQVQAMGRGQKEQRAQP
jgi:hypothetical protein